MLTSIEWGPRRDHGKLEKKTEKEREKNMEKQREMTEKKGKKGSLARECRIVL